MVVQLQTGERIHYLEWSPAEATGAEPRVPVVLVHGLARTAWSWLPVARRLAAHHVVAPDLRGHGASDAPRTGYELESLAGDVLTVMAGCGWGEAVEGPPAVVAGHGLGAMVAVEMARLQPDSVAAWRSSTRAGRRWRRPRGCCPMQLVEAMAEPPEVMASLDAYLADRRDFDPATWDADQETAARAQVNEKHAGHVGLRDEGLGPPPRRRGDLRIPALTALAEVRCSITVLVADATTADDEDRRERDLALEDAQRARAAAGRRSDAGAAVRGRGSRPDAPPAGGGRG